MLSGDLLQVARFRILGEQQHGPCQTNPYQKPPNHFAVVLRVRAVDLFILSTIGHAQYAASKVTLQTCQRGKQFSDFRTEMLRFLRKALAHNNDVRDPLSKLARPT